MKYVYSTCKRQQLNTLNTLIDVAYTTKNDDMVKTQVTSRNLLFFCRWLVEKHTHAPFFINNFHVLARFEIWLHEYESPQQICTYEFSYRDSIHIDCIDWVTFLFISWHWLGTRHPLIYLFPITTTRRNAACFPTCPTGF